MATIEANILIAWLSTVASIPSNWSRETTLDGRHIRGAANGADGGGTGGSNTHSHTTSSHTHGAGTHTHTVNSSGAASGTVGGDASGTAHAADAHTHTSNADAGASGSTSGGQAPDTSSDNNEPEYVTSIFLKSNGSASDLPSNGYAWWNSTTAPSGWTFADGTGGTVDVRSKFLKGAATSADGGGTGGTTTHTHTMSSHTHGDVFGHYHDSTSNNNGAGFNVHGSGSAISVNLINHTHALQHSSYNATLTMGSTNNASSTSSNNPPYKNIALVKNTSGAGSTPVGIICMWVGTLTSVPSTWLVCDGTSSTPDMRTYFAQQPSTISGVGGSGGSLTSSHTAGTHDHTIASHTHTITVSNGATEAAHAGSSNSSINTHTHTWTGNAGSGTSATQTPTITNNTSVQPAYTDVIFVQYQGYPSKVCTPPTKTLTLTSYAPVLKINVTTATQTTTLTKYAPVLKVTLTPTTRSTTLTGYAPVLKVGVIPATQTLTISTYIPTIVDTPPEEEGEFNPTLFDEVAFDQYPFDGVLEEAGAEQPTVVTGTVINPGSYDATLNGTLSDLGDATSVVVSFEYGLTDSYGSSAVADESPMTTTGLFSASLTGLNPGSTYHFRAKAVGEGDPVYGSDETFDTDPCSPYYQSLTLTCYAPTLKVNVIPTTRTLTLTSYAPVLKVSVIPTTRTLTITKYAPVLKIQVTGASPTALTLTKYAPVLKIGVIPTTQTLILTKYAPVLKIQVTGASPTALTITKYAPVLKINVIPTTRTLTLTSYAPPLGVKVVVPVKALTLTGYAPVLKIFVVPTTKTLTLTTYIPTVTESASLVCTPPNATLTITQYAPVLKINLVTGVKTLTLSTYIPSVVTGITVEVPKATLTLSKYAPLLKIAIIPTTKTLALTGYAPSLGIKLVPTTKSITITKYAPSVDTYTSGYSRGEYLNSGDYNYDTVYYDQWYAQTFTPTMAQKLYFVRLKLQRVVQPTTITVEITTTSSSHPTSTVLASASITPSAVPVYPASGWVMATLSTPVFLDAGTKYAIVLSITGSSADLSWAVGDNNYSGGAEEWSTDKVNWTTYSDNDLLFELWGHYACVPSVKTLTLTPYIPDIVIPTLVPVVATPTTANLLTTGYPPVLQLKLVPTTRQLKIRRFTAQLAAPYTRKLTLTPRP